MFNDTLWAQLFTYVPNNAVTSVWKIWKPNWRILYSKLLFYGHSGGLCVRLTRPKTTIRETDTKDRIKTATWSERRTILGVLKRQFIFLNTASRRIVVDEIIATDWKEHLCRPSHNKGAPSARFTRHSLSNKVVDFPPRQFRYVSHCCRCLWRHELYILWWHTIMC